MPYQKGQSGNPAGRPKEDPAPTRDGVLRYLWRLVKRQDPSHAAVQGCKALLESFEKAEDRADRTRFAWEQAQRRRSTESAAGAEASSPESVSAEGRELPPWMQA